MDNEEQQLYARVIDKIGPTVPAFENYGYPNQIELAIIDSVLSIRANYGSSATPRVYAVPSGATRTSSDPGASATTSGRWRRSIHRTSARYWTTGSGVLVARRSISSSKWPNGSLRLASPRRPTSIPTTTRSVRHGAVCMAWPT